MNRSAIMSRIRSANTHPEIAVRKRLHALGFRFRLHRRDLPGKPDIVLPRLKTAIFVHGCFWHQHEGCKLASKPKTRQDYWGPKLAGNVARDRAAQAALAVLGWRVEIIWECDARKPDALERSISAAVAPLGAKHAVAVTKERHKENAAPTGSTANARSGSTGKSSAHLPNRSAPSGLANVADE